jgi:FAD:protein FMN transferase
MSDSSASNRRQFLTGEAALRSLQQLGTTPSFPEANPTWSGAQQAYHLVYSRRAMACDFQVTFPFQDSAPMSETAVAALDLVETLEAQLTIYRDTSEISRLNRTAATGPQFVEARLFQLLQQADQLWHATNGAYDIATGQLSRLWGFAQRAGKMPDATAIPIAIQNSGWQHVQLDREQQTIAFDQPGVELNLASIGKGYALDRCAELFVEQSLTNFALHGGNSSLLARGQPADDSAWWIGVRDPLRPERRLCEVALRDRAIGTSGAAVQFFIHQGQRYGHILDPRTGWPAKGMLSVTVLAPTAAEADALSTALYVLGPTAAADYLQQRPDVAALLFVPSDKTGQWQVQLHGIDTSEIRISKQETP